MLLVIVRTVPPFRRTITSIRDSISHALPSAEALGYTGSSLLRVDSGGVELALSSIVWQAGAPARHLRIKAPPFYGHARPDNFPLSHSVEAGRWRDGDCLRGGGSPARPPCGNEVYPRSSFQ